jgi:hypothetical protein
MIEREQGDEMTLEAEVDLMHTRLLHHLGHHELAIKAAELIRRQAEEIERLRAEIAIRAAESLCGEIAIVSLPNEAAAPSADSADARHKGAADAARHR